MGEGETAMNITIASFDRATEILRSLRARDITHVVSIGDPGHPMPEWLERHHASKLRLEFHDTSLTSGALVPPNAAHVQRVVDFAASMREESVVLTHCVGGISRSSAAALIIMASRLDASAENAARVMDELVKIKWSVMPNELMVWVADTEVLGWGGMLHAAYRRRFKAGTAALFPVEE